MKDAKTWLGVILFAVVVTAAVVIFILPNLGTNAPGGPELSFGGSETCKLGASLAEFNAAGFYMSESAQEHTYTGLSTQTGLKVYLSADRTQSCGTGRLVNKGDKWLKGSECMLYSFSLTYADGAHMTCNGVETLGNTQEAIRAALGRPTKPYTDHDQYSYSKMGRDYDFTFYYDESGICTKVSAAQVDPDLSFQSY